MTKAEIVQIVETSIAKLSDDDQVLWMRFMASASVGTGIGMRGSDDVDGVWWGILAGGWFEVSNRGGWGVSCGWQHEATRCFSRDAIGPAIITVLHEGWLMKVGVV